MDQEQFKKILDESGKRPQWLLEHLTSSGSWRPIIYNIGQEKLLSQVDNSNRRYAVFIEKKHNP